MAAPRPYQSDALEAAKEKNILLVLPTNAGKTRVATLLIDWFLEMTPRIRTSPKKVVFLAPTCPLVEQQYNVLLQDCTGVTSLQEATTAYSDDAAGHLIALACGPQKRTKAKEALTEWSARIVVCTPELLVKSLTHADVCMKDIGLLVLDEAHHCVNGDSYRIIMHRFYTSAATQDRPRILAMTASPFKGVAEAKASEKGKLEDALHRIESLLHCHTWTQDIANVLQLHTNCKQSRHATTPQDGITHGITELGMELLQMIRKTGGLEEENSPSSDANRESRLLAWENFVNRFTKDILQALGLWAACHFLSLLLDDSCVAGVHEEDLLADIGGLGSPSTEGKETESASRQKGLDRAHFNALATRFQQWRRDNPSVESVVLQKPLNHASDKLLKLKELLEEELSGAESSKALVFVQQRQTARIVADFLQACGGPIGSRTGFVMSSRQAGNNPRMSASPSVTKDHLQRFRETDHTSDSYLSVLCSTSVLCEGIDVRSCVLVISFDMPNTPLQNIQQRGRARAMQACYVHMVGGGEDEEKLRQFCVHESLLKELLEERVAAGEAPPVPLPKVLPTEEEVLTVPETGALLPVERAKAFLEAVYAECSEEEVTSLDFKVKVLNGPAFTASLRLPPLTCAEMVDEEEVQMSGAKSTRKGAVNAVALQACHRLRELGVLDDNLHVVGRSLVLRASDGQDLHKGRSQQRRIDDLAALKMKEELVRVLPRCLRRSDGWVLHAVDGIPGARAQDSIGEKIGLLLPRSVPGGRLRFALQNQGNFFELLLRAVGEVELSSESVEELSSWTQGCLEVANVQAKCTHRAKPCIKLEPATGAYLKAEDGAALEAAVPSKQVDLEDAAWLLMPYQDGLLRPDWDLVRLWREQVQAPSSQWPSLALAPCAEKVYVPGCACACLLQDALVLHEELDGKREALFSELHTTSPHDSEVVTTLRGVRVSRTNINSVCSIKSKAKVCQPGLTLQVAKCKLAPLSFGQFQLLQLLPSILWRLEHLALCIEVSEELATRGELLQTNPSQLAEALTHGRAACLPVDPSQCDRPFHYERLEFFGDALLKFCSAVHAYSRWPDADQEILSKASQKFQTNKYLHKCGKALPLRDALLARGFERRTNLTDLRRQQVSVKEQADIVEAFLGAVFAAGLPGLEAASAAVWAAFQSIIVGSKRESPVELMRPTVQAMREMWPTEDRAAEEWWGGHDERVRQVERVQQLETVLNYRFERRSFLSILLPVHPRSREEEREFQRLEFLGDSVLQAMSSKKVVDELPALDEGQMSDVRAGLVCNKFLARRIARRFGAGAGELLFHARPAMRKKVNDYTSKVLQDGRDQWEADYVLGKVGHHDCSAAAVSTLFKLVLDVAQEYSHGSFLDGPKEVADVYEALMGAVFIDTGGDLERTWAIFEEDFAVPRALILRRQQESRDEQAKESLQGQALEKPPGDHASEPSSNAPGQRGSGGLGADGLAPAGVATTPPGLEGHCRARHRQTVASMPNVLNTPFIAGKDYKSQLNLHVMQAGCEYRLVQQSGLPHEMVFISQVRIRAKDLLSVGKARSTIQESEQAAAFEALLQLGYIQADGTSVKGRDYKSSLNQCLMKDPHTSCQYRRVSATGAGNTALFTSEVEIDFLELLCEGQACKTIKASEHSAAFVALLSLGVIGADAGS